VALAARSAEPLEALARRLQGTAHPVDLADAAALDGFIARVEAEGGPLDVLVNNAGLELSAPIDGMRTDELERLVRVNLTAPMELCRQALPGMIAPRVTS
jgi:NADP-dependent 3-hydroxy acid dehydrogenase YdfG